MRSGRSTSAVAADEDVAAILPRFDQHLDRGGDLVEVDGLDGLQEVGLVALGELH